MPKTSNSTTDKHCREHYGVKFLLSQHPDLRRLKANDEQPSIHGNKFWGSSYLLMDYLEQEPLEPNSKVLELGCGWGLAGIYCAKYQQAEVTGLDADEAVFPYLQLHAQHNGVEINTHTNLFEELSSKQLGQYDVIIAADICFWDELTDVVYQLINRAVAAGVKKIIIADPQRPPFYDLAERCIEEHFAELEDRAIDQPRRATGSLLVIENS